MPETHRSNANSSPWPDGSAGSASVGERNDPPLPVCRFAWDPLARRVRFTYLWLEHQATDEYDLSVEFCHQHWPRITGTIERLFAETEWRQNPSFLCNYCPYHENACTPPPPRTNDDALLGYLTQP